MSLRRTIRRGLKPRVAIDLETRPLRFMGSNWLEFEREALKLAEWQNAFLGADLLHGERGTPKGETP